MGVFDSYCPICGITTNLSFWYPGYEVDNWNDFLKEGKITVSSNQGTRRKYTTTKNIDPIIVAHYKKLLRDIQKLEGKIAWMSQRFLITGNNKILEIDLSNENHGDHHFDVNGRSYYYEKYLWDYSEEKSLYCHQSCYKLLKKKLGYKLTIADIEHKLDDYALLPSYGKTVDKFTRRQDFPWIDMILNKNLYQSIQNNKKLEINARNVSFLMNPLKDKDNQERILEIWKPIVHKISSKKKKTRPSPSDSATLYTVGKVKKGNDGNMYKVVKNKNNIKRWQKIMKK